MYVTDTVTINFPNDWVCDFSIVRSTRDIFVVFFHRDVYMIVYLGVWIGNIVSDVMFFNKCNIFTVGSKIYRALVIIPVKKLILKTLL